MVRAWDHRRVAGTLYLVGTPIGNLGDLSERARETLASADIVAAEDTRRTGRLLQRFGVNARTVSFFEGNERQRTAALLRALREGRDVAVVSDAGMPGLSDPGFRLVRACAEEGLEVRVVPGPSAVIAALVVSGLPTDRFVFAELQRTAERMVRDVIGADLEVPVMNYPSVADAVVQFSVPEFEYPRGDLTTPVHFVGPVSLADASTVELPAWWDELHDGRPVVHVTQGTVANGDLSGLVLPTFEALADRDVLVVATTGGRDVPSLALPANARIAPYLPYDRLFPLLSAFVTNGGYGGVQYALAHGVPIVAAGDSEDKSEVSARVAWSGAGLRLRPRDGLFLARRACLP